MGEVQVCRICLNMDVKMFDLQSEPLETYFTSIMIESKVNLQIIIKNKIIQSVMYNIDLRVVI